MALKSFRPLTASLRFTTLNRPAGLSKNRPERSLVESKSKTGGRNTYGRITSRRRGGGHKKLYRIIDLRRDKLDMAGIEKAIGEVAKKARDGKLGLPDFEGGWFAGGQLGPRGIGAFLSGKLNRLGHGESVERLRMSASTGKTSRSTGATDMT